MRAIKRTTLDEIREKEQQNTMKDAQLQQLGLSLAEEKLKSAQKNTMINELGSEVAQLKIKVLRLEGDANK